MRRTATLHCHATPYKGCGSGGSVEGALPWQWNGSAMAVAATRRLLLALGTGFDLNVSALVDCDRQRHRPTADLTILDAVLLADGRVDQDL